ncbi:MAG: serine/threonine protein kinase [Devosia sp.]|uniref:serine/threonine-protein kinase n=1 Tax=Devosia sp. TaxID=1871048 RepID=UPI001AC358C0|nr:serine/threonine-protein kinase [Devosia sp.]MBN9316406.1 serine/threonine protein kinase [Devosia sp.]
MILPKRYKHEKSFSAGGMSDAAKCIDTHLDRPVLVKALKEGTDKKRLLDEIRALQKIRSKHVVQIYDVVRDEDGEIQGLVEEYIEGADLTYLNPPTTAEDLMKLFYPIAKGIAEIHDHGHIHRDVKRQNMKFDGEGCLKIFDFGLARDETADASTIGPIGTPGYMAPELFVAGTNGKTSFTTAIDVYAFGVTAISLARGTMPNGLKGIPPKLPAADADFNGLPQSLPPAVATLLNQCLAADPTARPKMSEVAEELSLHLLHGQHRAFVGFSGRLYVLDATHPAADLSVAGQGALRVRYDGLRFLLENVTGHVALNNQQAFNGMVVPGSCVIMLGLPYPSARTAITIDVSHPEVTL